MRDFTGQTIDVGSRVARTPNESSGAKIGTITRLDPNKKAATTRWELWDGWFYIKDVGTLKGVVKEKAWGSGSGTASVRNIIKISETHYQDTMLIATMFHELNEAVESGAFRPRTLLEAEERFEAMIKRALPLF